MAATKNKSSRVRDVLFILLGTILGAGLSYVSGHDLNRLQFLRGTQRDAYVDFLRAQVLLDLGKNSAEYATNTVDARKRIAIYGSSDVVEALAKYYRNHANRPDCGREKEKLHDDATIYLNMRQDLVPFWQQVSEADMMMLLFFCRLSE
jgi:hypothetical protein